MRPRSFALNLSHFGSAEVLIMDSIDCHEKLFGAKTPLMNAFFTRFLFENPQVIASPDDRASYFEGAEVNNVLKLGRPKFLQICLKRRSEKESFG